MVPGDRILTARQGSASVWSQQAQVSCQQPFQGQSYLVLVCSGNYCMQYLKTFRKYSPCGQHKQFSQMISLKKNTYNVYM